MWQAIHRTRELSLLPARALTALGNFQALIDDLDRSSETLPLDELTEHVIEVTGLLDYHVPRRGARSGPGREPAGTGDSYTPLRARG